MTGKGGRARNASSLPRGSGQAAGYNLNLRFGTIVAEIFQMLQMTANRIIHGGRSNKVHPNDKSG